MEITVTFDVIIFVLNVGNYTSMLRMRSLNVLQRFKRGFYQLHRFILIFYMCPAYSLTWIIFFWWKNSTEDSEIDIDPCLWIIWCLCKKRNDKLFRKIDRNPIKLIRYVKRKIGLTPNFRANKPNAELVQPTVNNISSLMLGEHMFGKWILDLYIDFQWKWTDMTW